MRYSNRLLFGLLFLCLTFFLLAGCLAESEEEPSPPSDITPPEESQAQIELRTLQAKYDELSASYDNVKSELETRQAEHDDLIAKHDELDVKYNELNAKYNELSTKYDELSAKYDAMMQEPEPIKEEDLEQLIFELINQERINNRVRELEWSDGLHWYAKQHSQDMARMKRLVYSDYSYWQDIFQAAGYRTVDEIANAAMIVWKDSLQYETNFLKASARYGAVGVAKSGEVFYITYFAHIY